MLILILKFLFCIFSPIVTLLALLIKNSANNTLTASSVLTTPVKKEKLNDANDVNSHMNKMSYVHGVFACYWVSVMMHIVDVVTDDLILTILIISHFVLILFV